MRKSRDSSLSGDPLSEEEGSSAAHRTATLNEKEKKELEKEIARHKIVDAKLTEDRTQQRQY